MAHKGKGFLFGGPAEEVAPEEAAKEDKKFRRQMAGPMASKDEEEPAAAAPVEKIEKPEAKPSAAPPEMPMGEMKPEVMKALVLDPALHPDFAKVKVGDEVTITGRVILDIAPDGRTKRSGLNVKNVTIGPASPALKE
jgi:hypothetical protein